MRDQRGENELPAVFAPPDQDGLQLELQCLILVSDAQCVLRLPVAAAKGVDRGAQFRFALVGALDNAAEVMAEEGESRGGDFTSACS